VNPYLLDLPAVISFSGGRTSGYMLRRILDAHGGQPEDLKICFQNTGLEHAATYEFVKDCAHRWDCDITWLEYCVKDGDHDFRVVDYDSASRNGEPFSQLIEKRGYLPSVVARICTTMLKMRTMDKHIRTLPGFEDGYTNAVGLRADEPHRAQRIKSDNSREEIICPIYENGETEVQVLEFWKEQPFDLNLPLRGNMAGNCVGCFLKKRSKIELLAKEMPEYFNWWIDAEKWASQRSDVRVKKFREDRPSYAKIIEMTERQGWLQFEGDADEVPIPCMCHD
tara:strand:- start:4104 stop:4946 length:843 start_codon:yes stop_codon:yes gene_type:complete